MINQISILIPAKNEESNLSILVPKLFQYYKNNILEIIIIDDNSTDNTNKTAHILKTKFKKIKIIRRKDHPGVGRSIKAGLKSLSKRACYILLMDCDFITNIGDIKYFIKNISKYDGITGSRFIKAYSLENYPKLKYFANRSFHFLAKYLLSVRNSDLTNNFKLYKINTIRKIMPLLISSDFAINAEIGYYPVLLGMNIGQVPVHWKERTSQMGLSKFKIFRVGPSYFIIFLRCLFIKWGLINKISTINPNNDTNPPK